MKKLFTVFAAVLLAVSSAAFAACAPQTVRIDENSEYIVITPNSKITEITEETSLLDYMAVLKDRGELEYETSESNGMIMIMSINGRENPADWSYCWMLYTDDTENVNDSLTLTYEEKTYSQTMTGCDEVIIKEGLTYIWYYQAF